jgi:hypothetical protein
MSEAAKAESNGSKGRTRTIFVVTNTSFYEGNQAEFGLTPHYFFTTLLPLSSGSSSGSPQRLAGDHEGQRLVRVAREQQPKRTAAATGH